MNQVEKTPAEIEASENSRRVQVDLHEEALIEWLNALTEHQRFKTNRSRQHLANACSKLRTTLVVVKGEGVLAALKAQAEKDAAPAA